MSDPIDLTLDDSDDENAPVAAHQPAAFSHIILPHERMSVRPSPPRTAASTIVDLTMELDEETQQESERRDNAEESMGNDVRDTDDDSEEASDTHAEEMEDNTTQSAEHAVRSDEEGDSTDDTNIHDTAEQTHDTVRESSNDSSSSDDEQPPEDSAIKDSNVQHEERATSPPQSPASEVQVLPSPSTSHESDEEMEETKEQSPQPGASNQSDSSDKEQDTMRDVGDVQEETVEADKVVDISDDDNNNHDDGALRNDSNPRATSDEQGNPPLRNAFGTETVEPNSEEHLKSPPNPAQNEGAKRGSILDEEDDEEFEELPSRRGSTIFYPEEQHRDDDDSDSMEHSHQAEQLDLSSVEESLKQATTPPKPAVAAQESSEASEQNGNNDSSKDESQERLLDALHPPHGDDESSSVEEIDIPPDFSPRKQSLHTPHGQNTPTSEPDTITPVNNNNSPAPEEDSDAVHDEMSDVEREEANETRTTPQKDRVQHPAVSPLLDEEDTVLGDSPSQRSANARTVLDVAITPNDSMDLDESLEEHTTSAPNTQTSTLSHKTHATGAEKDDDSFESYDYFDDMACDDSIELDASNTGILQNGAHNQEEHLDVITQMRLFAQYLSGTTCLEDLLELSMSDFTRAGAFRMRFWELFKTETRYKTMLAFCKGYLTGKSMQEELRTFLHPPPGSKEAQELAYLAQVSKCIAAHHAKPINEMGIAQTAPFCMALLHRPSQECITAAPADIVFLRHTDDNYALCITSMCQQCVAFEEQRVTIPLVQKMLLFSEGDSDFYLVRDHTREVYIVEVNAQQRTHAERHEVRFLHEARQTIDAALWAHIKSMLDNSIMAECTEFASLIEDIFHDQQLALHRGIVKRRISLPLLEYFSIIDSLPEVEKQALQKLRRFIKDNVAHHLTRMVLSLTFGRSPDDMAKIMQALATDSVLRSPLRRRIKAIRIQHVNEIYTMQKSVDEMEDTDDDDTSVVEMFERNISALALYSVGFSSLFEVVQYSRILDPNDSPMSHVQHRLGGSFVVDNIAPGKSPDPVRLVNDLDLLAFLPAFEYVDELEEADTAFSHGCQCVHDCTDDKFCACAQQAYNGFAYKDGRLKDQQSAIIFECNSKCDCSSDCSNRVAQPRSRYRRMYSSDIEVFHNGHFWGGRTRRPIPCGAFVMEYTGERVTDEEAERRGRVYDSQGLSYLFDVAQAALANLEDVGHVSIDAQHQGSVARFFNHSCDPNLIPKEVCINNQDVRAAHICFFALRDIAQGEELVFNYGYENKQRVRCLCGAENCRGYLL